MLRDFIERDIKNIRSDFLRKLPPGFSDSRQLYRSAKVDPTKHRPSSEALWRRIKKELPFPEVNCFVDMINYLSLKHQVSYGLYDVDKLEGNIIVKLGNENDMYEGIRKDMVSLRGKITLFDEKGPFGNPSSDSLRTSTSPETKSLIIIIFNYKQSQEIKLISDDTFAHFSKYFDF